MNILQTWFEEVWNNGREEMIDVLSAPDVVAHGLVDAQGCQICGRELFHGFWRRFRETFPDLRIEVEMALKEGDNEMVRCTARATHGGNGFGFAATQKPVTFTGMVLARVQNGQLVEVWDNWDFLSLYQQLGAMPAVPAVPMAPA